MQRHPPGDLDVFALRFTLSYRDVEDLLAERGIEVSYETVRRWLLTFGARQNWTARFSNSHRETRANYLKGGLNRMRAGRQGV
jgi:hypothetical protein